MRIATAVLVAATVGAAQGPPPMTEFTAATATEHRAQRHQAAAVLDRALREEPTVERLTAAGRHAGALLSKGSRQRARLRGLVANAEDPDDLADDLDEVRLDLDFEPLREAPVPIDWPPPAPVGEIVLKSYPGYRMATAPMASDAASGATFMRLFRHIERNDIAMTAPVQTTYRDPDHAAPKPAQMAFLYRSEKDGPAGTDDGVDVVDVAPTLALSMGFRGRETRSRIAALVTELQRALAAHPDLRADGPPRVMGYNSPMVPDAQRFFEVELPVRRVARGPRVF